MKKRNPALCILFCIITFGIYYIYWFVKLTNDSNEMSPENKTASGGLAYLFCIISFGFYSFYWHYKLGVKTRNSGGLFLILCFIGGIGIWINLILAQSDINKYIDNQAAAPAQA